MRKFVGHCLAFATAIGGGASAAHALSNQQIVTLSGPDRQKILESGARKEGEVLWIGSLNDDNARPIIAGFTARYPFIKVNRVRTDSTQAAQRVLLELNARSPDVDLITSDDVVALEDAQAVQAFRSPTLDLYPEQVRDTTGFTAPLYFMHYGVAAYNTDQLTAAQAPKTYDDLLDPKWKGQMVFNNKESGALFLITFLRLRWGDVKAHSYLEKLAKQNVVSRSESARTVLGKVVSGEYKIMINPTISHVGEFARMGAPVAVSMQDPVPMSEDPLLMAKTAPHPYATMLLIDYLLGSQAQTILRDEGYFPGNPTVAPAPEMKPYQPELKGIGKFLVDDRAMGQMRSQSMAWYLALFQ